MSGNKFDTDKVRFDLVDPDFELALAKVLTHGAAKYAPGNWKTLDDPINRYYGALRRHLNAWRSGELIDPESGEPHLAHAACNLMFLSYFKGGEDAEDTDLQGR